MVVMTVAGKLLCPIIGVKCNRLVYTALLWITGALITSIVETIKADVVHIKSLQGKQPPSRYAAPLPSAAGIGVVDWTVMSSQFTATAAV